MKANEEKIRFRFVTEDTDRHGNVRRYFRRNGKKVRLQGLPGSPEFIQSYRAAYLGLDVPKEPLLMLPSRIRQKSKINVERYRQRQTGSGVYLLMLKGRIVYVGESEDMATRVVTHRVNGRQFDRAYYIGAQGSQERKALEALLIAALSPDQNRRGKRQTVNGSMSHSNTRDQRESQIETFHQ